MQAVPNAQDPMRDWMANWGPQLDIFSFVAVTLDPCLGLLLRLLSSSGDVSLAVDVS